MKTCAVRTCGNDSSKRPDLCFFNLPRDPFRREDWLEALKVISKESVSSIAVCEAHFKKKDFKTGKKKDLKTHAIPIANLGQVDSFDSDDDFQDFPFVSENDPEILEIQTEVFSTNPQCNVKQEPVEEQEPIPDPEPETGRRPSRRAALVAAKKIFNTVRNLGINDNSAEFPANPVPSPKTAPTPHPYTRPKSKKNPPVNVDLQMDCCDDFLSPIQAEFLLKAQIQYNMVMKNLRELMACNVKVIQTDANGVPTVVTSAPSVNLKSGNATVNSKSAAIRRVNTGSAMVVPMKLIQSPIIIA